MRTVLIVAAALAVGGLLPLASASAESASYSDAGNQRTALSGSGPSFEDCYRLGWVRGVHVERFEFANFDAECMAGRIPFDSGNPATTIRRGAR